MLGRTYSTYVSTYVNIPTARHRTQEKAFTLFMTIFLARAKRQILGFLIHKTQNEKYSFKFNGSFDKK